MPWGSPDNSLLILTVPQDLMSDMNPAIHCMVSIVCALDTQSWLNFDATYWSDKMTLPGQLTFWARIQISCSWCSDPDWCIAFTIFCANFKNSRRHDPQRLHCRLLPFWRLSVCVYMNAFATTVPQSKFSIVMGIFRLLEEFLASLHLYIANLLQQIQNYRTCLDTLCSMLIHEWKWAWIPGLMHCALDFSQKCM